MENTKSSKEPRKTPKVVSIGAQRFENDSCHGCMKLLK